jgi:hypothetical protein
MIGRLLSGFFIILFVLLPVFFINSCSTETSCTENMTSTLNAGFYYWSTVNGKRILSDSLVTGVVIRGINRSDSFLYNAGVDKTFKKISLSLPQLNDTALFVVNLNSIWVDTLHVRYKRKTVFVNYNCGFRSEFTLDSAWFSLHPIDSIKIIHPYVSTSILENCKIILYRDLGNQL